MLVVQCKRAVVHNDGLAEHGQFEERPSLIIVRFDKIRFYFERPVERRNRLLKGVECKKRPSHQVPGIGISGIDLQYFLVRSNGIVVPAKVEKDHSPVEPSRYRPGI